MKPFARTASVRWLRTPQRGRGTIRRPNAVLKVALHAARGNLNRRGTDPPELLAAAHAGSFSVTLANELAEAGYPPRQIETTAKVTMLNQPAGWTVAQIDLDVVAGVPGVADGDFVDAALRAKANCPISRALNANISMRARLSRRETRGPGRTRTRSEFAPASESEEGPPRPRGRRLKRRTEDDATAAVLKPSPPR